MTVYSDSSSAILVVSQHKSLLLEKVVLNTLNLLHTKNTQDGCNQTVRKVLLVLP